METLGDYTSRMEGTELGEQLRKQVNRASHLRGGVDFSNVRVKSVAEMGEAAGTFHTGTKEVALREDTVSTRAGIRKVCEVLVHESIHQGDPAVDDSENHSEGYTHWLTLDTLQAANNSAYPEEVSQIETIANKLGREKVRAIGRGKNPELSLWMAYIQFLVKAGTDLPAAKEEADARMQAAA